MGNVLVTDINASVWVSASAGTGKTKNLIDRILSLLVHGVKPSKILCLTYTKNAASEMLLRLNSFITRWSSAQQEDVKSDLLELGVNVNLCDIARNLSHVSITQPWVSIRTIHSFCQDLIAMFPVETEIAPGSKVLDDAEQKRLLESAYINVLKNESFHNDIDFILKYKGSAFDLIGSNLRELRGFFNHYDTADIDDIYNNFFDVKPEIPWPDDIRKICSEISEFFSDPQHINALKNAPNEDIFSIFFKENGERRARILKAGTVRKNRLEEHLKIVSEFIYEIKDIQNRKMLADINSSFMRISAECIKQYNKLKKNRTAIDFDDIIIAANSILQKYEYVRETVDGMLDHVLIDEAQDTSVQQWDIIKNITSDFFYRTEKTIFVVGDKKQSIYSFQGADHNLFSAMHDYYKEGCLTNGKQWHDVDLNTSYRFGETIINFVNKVFVNETPHSTARTNSPSSVIAHPIYTFETQDKEEKFNHLCTVAHDIALSIKDTLDSHVLVPSEGRAAEPKDFLILSQRRSELQELIARELKKLNIPCSGRDRIHINRELCVEDMISLAKFCLSTYDDMNCAIVLKSPLISISEDELFNLCTARQNISLWEYFTNQDNYSKHIELLQKFISSTHLPTYEFFMKIVSEADRLFSNEHSADAVNAFLEICANSPACSLQSFVSWFEESDFQIRKDRSTANEVSMMTAHGSKGLQAPFVIIVDAAFANRRADSLVSCGNHFVFLSHSVSNPECVKIYLENTKEKELQESKRLLYVAVTRAEDSLQIYAHKFSKNTPDTSWYSIIGEEQFHKEEFTEGAQAHTNTIERQFPQFSKISHKEKHKDKTHSELYGDLVHLFLEKLTQIDRQEWDSFFDTCVADRSIKIPEDEILKAYQEALGVLLDEKISELMRFSLASEAELCYNGSLKRLDCVISANGDLFVVDFKTGHEDAKNESYIAQLNGYASMLQQMHPGKRVRAFILWTKTRKLFEVTDVMKEIDDESWKQMDLSWRA